MVRRIATLLTLALAFAGCATETETAEEQGEGRDEETASYNEGTEETSSSSEALSASGSPTGSLGLGYSPNVDRVIHVQGWARDPDTKLPVRVKIFINNVYVDSWVADQPNQRYYFRVNGFPGVNRVCAWGANVGTGASAELSCMTVDLGPIGPKLSALTGNPYGEFSVSQRGNSLYNAGGWAIDPDTSDPVPIELWLNGRRITASGLANVSRPDRGPRGINFVFPGRPGQEVCADAINVGRGRRITLGCRRLQ